MVRTRRESHQWNGITDPKNLQPPFATKSAKSRLMQCSKKVLLDHLVGAVEQCGRNNETERLGGFKIDGKIELRRLLDGEVYRFGSGQDLRKLLRVLTAHLRKTRPIRDKPSFFGGLRPLVDSG
jgi:hypothetical protein